MTMTALCFEEKLKKVNPNLYIDKEHITYATNPELGSSGIYLKNRRRDYINPTGLEYDYKKAVETHNAADDYITWVTKHIVFESDQFTEEGKRVALGWRTIVKKLVKDNLITSKKAKAIFGWEESDYDRLTFEEKRAQCLQRHTDIPVTKL